MQVAICHFSQAATAALYLVQYLLITAVTLFQLIFWPVSPSSCVLFHLFFYNLTIKFHCPWLFLFLMEPWCRVNCQSGFSDHRFSNLTVSDVLACVTLSFYLWSMFFVSFLLQKLFFKKVFAFLLLWIAEEILYSSTEKWGCYWGLCYHLRRLILHKAGLIFLLYCKVMF